MCAGRRSRWNPRMLSPTTERARAGRRSAPSKPARPALDRATLQAQARRVDAALDALRRHKAERERNAAPVAPELRQAIAGLVRELSALRRRIGRLERHARHDEHWS
jgi:hypothetical protein